MHEWVRFTLMKGRDAPGLFAVEDTRVVFFPTGFTLEGMCFCWRANTMERERAKKKKRHRRVQIKAQSMNVLQGRPGHALMDPICPCKSFRSIEVAWAFLVVNASCRTLVLYKHFYFPTNNVLNVKCHQFERIMAFGKRALPFNSKENERKYLSNSAL